MSSRKRVRDPCHAETAGLTIADAKFEFGIVKGGLIWIDEAITPDSSRLWEASAVVPGKTPPSFDKQFVRDYLETLPWNKTYPGPDLPKRKSSQERDRATLKHFGGSRAKTCRGSSKHPRREQFPTRAIPLAWEAK